MSEVKLNPSDIMRMDPNGDGVVTEGEANGLLEKAESQAVGHPGDGYYANQFGEAKALLKLVKAAPNGALRYFKGFDLNGDGSPDETGAGTISLDRLRNILDTDAFKGNGDGLLSVNEAMNGVYSNNYPAVDKDVERLPLKAEVRELGGNKYVEVDVQTPNVGFGNPDAAFTPDLDAVLFYPALWGREDYSQLLKNAGVKETKRGDVYSFLDSDEKPLAAFEAFLHVERQAFVADEFRDRGDEDRAKLLAAFEKKRVVPLSVRSIFRCAGPVAVRVYDLETGKIREVTVNHVSAKDGDCGEVPTFADYLRTFQQKDQMD